MSHKPIDIRFNPTKERLLIGIISDTHIVRTSGVPAKVKEIFRDVDLIIHAGDIVSLEAIEDLEKIAPVRAVYGNMDPPSVRKRLTSTLCIEIFEWRIGVRHDTLPLWAGWKMHRIAKENKLDVLIFGHTHRPFLKRQDNVLLINPGSPTIPLQGKPSVALLHIDKDYYEGEIVEIEKVR